MLQTDGCKRLWSLSRCPVPASLIACLQVWAALSSLGAMGWPSQVRRLPARPSAAGATGAAAAAASPAFLPPPHLLSNQLAPPQHPGCCETAVLARSIVELLPPVEVAAASWCNADPERPEEWEVGAGRIRSGRWVQGGARDGRRVQGG